MTAVRRRARQRRDAALIWLAGAPLVLAVLLLQLFGPLDGPLSSHDLATLRNELRTVAFLPGEITFVAVVAAHLFACLGAICIAAGLLRRTPRSAPFARTGMAVAAVFTLALPATAAVLPGNAVALSYGAFRHFFIATEAAPHFVRPVASIGPTPLDLAVLLPTAFGIVAVALMAAAAHAQLQLFRNIIEARGQRQAARIRQVHDRLKRCLYMLGLVLVTSTVAASLFFHLPSRFTAKNAEAAGLLRRFGEFASEISLFWGAVFSLTLAAAVGLPLLLLQERVRRSLEPPPLGTASDEGRQLLTGSGTLAEGREQLKFIAALLAPLAAGPMANFINSASAF